MADDLPSTPTPDPGAAQASPQPSTPVAVPGAPPTWDQIKTSPAYRNLTPYAAGLVFRRWVQDSQSFLDQNQIPKQNQQQFNSYIQGVAGKEFGMGIPTNDDGKPLTLGELTKLGGDSTVLTSPPGTPEALQYNLQTPYLVKQQAAPGLAFQSGLSHLISVPGKLLAPVYDYVTNTKPGESALDKGLAEISQSQSVIAALNPGGVKGVLENSIPEGAGNLAATVTGGGLAAGGIKGMAAFAAADASQETYHNAIESGATPVQAAQSAAVSGVVTTGEFLALDGIGSAAAKAAFGDNAANFASGLYRPTVAEALKYIGYDAAGQATAGAGGQVVQNLADQQIYDPDRKWYEGAGEAATQQAFFSLVHLPTLLQSFAGNATRIKDAAALHAQAAANLDAAQKTGNPEAIAAAQSNLDQTGQNYSNLLKTTAQNAPEPTMGDVQDAREMISGEKPVPGMNPLDDLNSDLEKAVTGPAEGEVAPEEPIQPKGSDETSQEEPAPTGTDLQSPSDTETPPAEAVEPDVSSEPESESQGESAVGAASESGGETAAPVDNAVPEASDTPEQSALRQRIVTALGPDIPKTAKIEFSTEHDNPAWVDPKAPGKIFVNPTVLGGVLKDSDEGFNNPKPGNDYIRGLLATKGGEEVIHTAQHALRGETDHEAIYNEITPEERSKTLAEYGDKDLDPETAPTPEEAADRRTRFVEEHARQLIQRKAKGETTEDIFKNAPKPQLIRYLQSLYQRVKAHLARFGDNSALGKYLKNIEDVLADAKKAGQDVVEGDVTNSGERQTDASNPDITAASKPTIFDKAKELGSGLKSEIFGLRKFNDLANAVNTWNAEEQLKTQKVEKIVKTIQKDIPSELRRSAISHYVEAAGDKATLANWQKQVEAGTKSDADKLYVKQLEAAQNLTPKEIDWANRITKNFDLTRQNLIKWGIPVGEVENYITHLWKRDSSGEAIRNITSRPLKDTFRFAGNRKVANFFEGWRGGLEPETTDASVILGHYMNEALGVINARKLIFDLGRGVMKDGRPIVSPNQEGNWIDVESPKGKARLLLKPFTWGAFKDYRSLDLPAFTNWYYNGVIDGKSIMAKGDMFVHPEAHEKFSQLFGQSIIKKWMNEPTGSALKKTAQMTSKFVLDDSRKWIKGTLLGGLPLFHIQQEAMGALGYGVNPIREALKSPVDLNDPYYYDMARHGVQFYASQTSLHNFMEGFKANNSLVLEAMERIPGLKDAGGKLLARAAKNATDWTFKQLIPRLKAQTYENILNRNVQRYAKELKSGKETLDNLKYQSAYDTNNAYGHLNYADLNRSPTLQHLFSIFALAPDFWEARVRHVASALTGAPVLGSKANREQFRSFAILGGGLYIAARVLNAALNNGDSHLEPENAFRIVEGNRAYQMRSYITDFQEMLANTRTYFSGRFNPVARFLSEGASGVNYRGEKVGSADIFRDLLAQTVPIPLQPLTRGLSETTKNSPVSPLEQFMGALGVKVSRFAPAQQIYPLAQKWLESQGKTPDRGIYPTSQYTPLKYALENSDYHNAYELYQNLVAANKGNPAKVIAGLQESINRPFTGSQADDNKFRASLSAEDQKIFDAAVERRHLLVQRFQHMMTMSHKK